MWEKCRIFFLALRPINLAMMLFFMLFYRLCYLEIQFDSSQLLFSFTDFVWMCLALVLGAGAGFLINDWYDRDLDLVNQPQKTFKILSKTEVWTAYVLLNLICGTVCTILVWKYDIQTYFWLYPSATMLLWFYSFRLKKILILSNFSIALLIAILVIFIFPFIELTHLQNIDYKHFNHLFLLTSLAFFLNFCREIVKDIEDRKGDASQDSKTLALVFGVNKTKQILVLLLGSSLLLIIYFCWQIQVESHIFFLYYSLLFFAILMLMIWIKFALKTKHFFWASQGLKLLMFFGILATILWI
ncbi:MAG: UbiA family prenyltransferase [Flavobacteriales bacterium]